MADETTLQAVKDRIDQINSDMEGVQHDLDYAAAQAKLDEIAPTHPGGTSSAQLVLEQHQERMDFLKKSKEAAEKYLKELQGKTS